MASDASNARPPSGGDSPAFTLQIISPSLGVPRGLSFAALSTGTTVRQLKDKITEALDGKPSEQTQRLIHRGRLLSRDTETMLEIFGEETLRSTEPQTLHLVLRDLSDASQASTPAPAVSGANSTQASTPSQTQPRGTPNNHPQQPQQPHIHHQHHAHHAHHHAFPTPPQMRPGPPPWANTAPFGVPQPPVMGVTATGPTPTMPFGYNPQQFTQQQGHMAAMNEQHRLHELIHQNQRARAAMGLNGAQDNQPAGTRVTPGNHTPGRTASPLQPDGTRTVVREGVSPNGQQWRITVNETITTTTPQGFQRNPRTGSPFSAADMQNMWRPPSGAAQPRSVPYPGSTPGGQLSGAEVQNILRVADSGQAATRAMTDAMRRNASNPSLVNLANSQASQPIPPGVTTPLVPSRAGSATGTPDPIRARGSGSSAPTSQPQPQASSGSAEVYILSSPEGPRALLVNGNLGTYFTPQNPQMQMTNPALRHQLQLQQFFPLGVHQPVINPPFMQLRQAQPAHRSPAAAGGFHVPQPGENDMNQNQQYQHQAPVPQGLPQLPQAQPQAGNPVVQPGNVQVRAVVVAQLWPHIWMVIRLGLFIWWFTSPTASWSRWFTVIAIACTLFFVNTGLLNPIAEQVWVPVRRHLENLMPLADVHNQEQPPRAENAQAADGNAPAQGQQRELNPADIAARLVQERRVANGNWLMTQARRLERAGILFLASIAPGVAERHIAEAEARVERQRIEAETAAAEAEAARIAAENGQAAEGANAEQSDGPAATANEPTRATEGDNARPQGAEEPLIEV